MFESYHRALKPRPVKCHITPTQRKFLSAIEDDWKTMREIAADAGISYDMARNAMERLDSKNGIEVKIISGDKPRLYRRGEHFSVMYEQD